MSAIQQIAKAASQNHGVTLQPLQVTEVMESFVSFQEALTATNYRLESLTYLTQIMISRLGGKVTMQAHELDDARDSDGFDVRWDEETDVITAELTRVAVPEVPVDDDSTEVGGPDLAPVSEESESDGLAEDATEEG